eukprot:TRINITY_DN20401_c0_g1_i1.p1 TRINITY_DN20401_c0_g1~~TRINITY_DN20401_c0_g1_i1.p1  ORF type:complete len:143 (-),score=20.37 TRINITY_DN20401_c0_g1_i1:208-636(-)
MPRRRRDASDSRSDSRRRGRGGGGRGRSRSRRRSRSRGGGLERFGTRGKVVEKKPVGFGFIRPESGQVDGNDLYFHCSTCSTHFDELQLDDEVTYEVGRDERNGRAVARKVKHAGGKGDRSDSRDRGRKKSRSRSPSYGRRR